MSLNGNDMQVKGLNNFSSSKKKINKNKNVVFGYEKWKIVVP